MKIKTTIVYSALILATAACNNEPKKPGAELPIAQKPVSDEFAELNSKARSLFGALPAVAENPDNAITTYKVELGKKLYFDKLLSKDNTQSCNTCHQLDKYGVDNNATSAGNNGGLGSRNSPTVYNAALHMAQFWDGREPDVEAQAGGPILNPVEMEMPSEAAVLARLEANEAYPALFKSAFPNENSPITYDNLKKAIGAFERTLITPSKFDDYMAGNNNALTKEEKIGLQTFIDVGCTTCHISPLLGGNMYQKFGLHADYWEHTGSKKIDLGKFESTGNEADKYIFKVPSLRNVEMTAPYFHDGSVADLENAIAIMGVTQLGKEISDDQIKSLVLFLKTLTGEIPDEFKSGPAS